jgi:outer membrane protein assembly factor BamD (BamD/ComL family)
MSVAGILSTSLYDLNTQSAQSKLQQSRQVFQQLGQDLQSGNLSAAQSDFAALQPSATSTSASSLLQNNSPVAQDLKQLSQDLQTGNVPAAQQDYTKMQQDFQNQVVAKHGHHHHGGGGGSGASGVSQLLQELGQELQSGNLTAAQQAYSTLQQDLPQFAQDSGLYQSSPASNASSVSVSA